VDLQVFIGWDPLAYESKEAETCAVEHAVDIAGLMFQWLA
jgi:hypothetical protein